jgi:hypothetical protein
VYFPLGRERRYRQGVPDQPLCQCLAAEPAPGCKPLGGHRVSPFFTASNLLPSTPHSSRGETFCRGKGRTCTRHVARTRPSSPSGKCDAITTGTLGKRPARDLHADARVSFLIYTWTPFYLKNPIKPLIWGKKPLQFFVAFCQPVKREKSFRCRVGRGFPIHSIVSEKREGMTAFTRLEAARGLGNLEGSCEW